MLLALDVGNTNVTLALFDGERLVADWRVSSYRERTADELAVELRQLFELRGFEFGVVDGVVVSSVVPNLNPALIEVSRRYLNCEPVMVGPGVKTSVRIRYDNPKDVGADRIANALAASLAVMVTDRSHQTQKARKGIAAALRTFRSLPHRLELVGEYGGVQWINDSKATNVSSAAVAIDGMERPTVLLLGGRHKGEAYTPLVDAVRRKVKKVIAFGEAAPIIATDLRPVVEVVRLGSDFDEVIRTARATARAGEAVLLSPACSSYDMFSNYEERGERFRALAAREA